jgi:hypothetical protein
MIEATPWGQHPKHLIHDRDRVYGADFATRLAGLGIESVRTPVRAPRANAIGERVVRTLRRECLDHILPLSERLSARSWPGSRPTTTGTAPIGRWGWRPRSRAIGRSPGSWSHGRSAEACTTSTNESPEHDSDFCRPTADGSAASGACARSWPATACSARPTWRRCWSSAASRGLRPRSGGWSRGGPSGCFSRCSRRSATSWA